MATWKVAPALAAACTAVLKPSELASVTCLELGEVCRDVGLPLGVLNIVTGLGLEAGAPLAAHPHVDKENIAKEFVEKLVSWIKRIKIFYPLEEGCRLGPVVSQGQGGSSTQYTGDGSVDIDGKPVLRSNTDNWRACPFILGIECCECLAYDGISTNLVTYLTNVLHEGNVSAVRNVTTWAVTCYLAPLIGAVLAYAYWERYQTIVVFSTIICSCFYIGGDYTKLVKEMKLDGFLFPSVIIFSSQWGLPLLFHPPFVSRNVVSLPRKLSLEYIYTLMNHTMHVCVIKGRTNNLPRDLDP